MGYRPTSTGQMARFFWEAGKFTYGMIKEAEAREAERQAQRQIMLSRIASIPDPMAGFASGRELDQYRYQNDKPCFFLGRVHPDHGRNELAGMLDDSHAFLVAGNRSGKGLTIGIPNALMWRGPLLMIDPKGEAASICALRRGSVEQAKGTGTSVRRFVGQQVAVLDPLGEVRGPARAFRVTYNPLDDIDMSSGGGVRAIRAAASAIIHAELGNAAHFSESGETLLAGVIEAVKLTEPPHRQTLPQCRSILLAGFDATHAYLKRIDTRAGLAQEAASLMSEVGDDEWGSFRSTLSRSLKWLGEPDMQDHVKPSAFSLRRAMQEGWSIFICLPPDQINDYRSWLRVIVRTALDAKMTLGTNQKGPATLCLLDEFPALGNFKMIEESAGYMAGYGIKLVPIIQNIGQVKNLYERNWETFLGNAGAIIGFGLNDLETETYFADRLGKIMVTESSENWSAGTSGQMLSGGISAGQAQTLSRHERPVRRANEIHEMGARQTMRGFVIPASGRGFTVERVPYTRLPADTYDAPDFITQWETKHWS